MPVTMKFNMQPASQRSSKGWDSSSVYRNPMRPRRMQQDSWETGDGTLSEKGPTSGWASHSKFVGTLRPDENERWQGGAWKSAGKKELEWDLQTKSAKKGIHVLD